MRKVSTSAVIHDACRGSQTTSPAKDARSLSTNDSTSAGSNFSLGGNWMRTGPSLDPNPAISPRKRCNGTSTGSIAISGDRHGDAGVNGWRLCGEPLELLRKREVQ